MSSTISLQFSTIHSRSYLCNRSHLHLLLRSKVLMMNNSNGHAIKASTSESRPVLSHTSKSHNDILRKPNSSAMEYVNGEEISDPAENVISEQQRSAKIHDFCFGLPYAENVISEQQRSAKIHDFCFGLPYGGIVFSSELLGFIFSRNPASLMTGGLYGGALLALSILSLKIWKQGQSSTPFILGQLGIAAALLWKNIQTYSLTKKILPNGFDIVLSTAMLCFYTYVIVSGGNPPPKKLKSSGASES